jgi:tRNA dimethylallyltransferase
MDIGTAKPSPADRARVPHHLIDVVDLTASFDAAAFVRLAEAALASASGRGRTSIFCGGTGLYFKAYLLGIGQAPAADPALRAELELKPLPELLQELERTDPALFLRIDRNNRRRVVRAIEVARLTGRPFSEQRADWAEPRIEQDQPKAILFGLTRGLEDLRRRIDERVDAMFNQGLVEEVKELMARGLADNPTASQALGYRQVLTYLQGAERSMDKLISEVKQKTRQYAKRQMTWFRNQAELEWFQVAPDEPAGSVAARIHERYVALAQTAGILKIH